MDSTTEACGRILVQIDEAKRLASMSPTPSTPKHGESHPFPSARGRTGMLGGQSKALPATVSDVFLSSGSATSMKRFLCSPTLMC